MLTGIEIKCAIISNGLKVYEVARTAQIPDSRMSGICSGRFRAAAEQEKAILEAIKSLCAERNARRNPS